MKKNKKELLQMLQIAEDQILDLVGQINDRSTIKNRIYAAYSTKIINELNILLKVDPIKIDDLTKFLASNWELIKGNMLCYTAMPDDVITKLLCEVAIFVTANSEQVKPKEVIKILMPTVNSESSMPSYPNLGDGYNSDSYSDVSNYINNILTTHILGSDGTYLVPISILVSKKTPEFTLYIAKAAELNLSYLVSPALIKSMGDDGTSVEYYIYTKDSAGSNKLELVEITKELERNFAAYTDFGEERFEQSMIHKCGMTAKLSALIEQSDRPTIADYKILSASKLPNPYCNLEYTNAELTTNDIDRLLMHSEATKAFNEIKTGYAALARDNNNLFGQLTVLCSRLYFNSVHSSGTETDADKGAYLAIQDFNEFYAKISPQQKEQSIPSAVNAAIMELLDIASPDNDVSINSMRSHQKIIGSCIAIRRETLLNAMRGHEVTLSKITTLAVSMADSLQIKSEQLLSALNELENKINQNYSGRDQLGLSLVLLKELDVKVRDLEELLTLAPDEITTVLLADGNAKNFIINATQTPEALCMFIINTPVEKLKAICKIVGDQIIGDQMGQILKDVYLLRNIFDAIPQGERRNIFMSLLTTSNLAILVNDFVKDNLNLLPDLLSQLEADKVTKVLFAKNRLNKNNMFHRAARKQPSLLEKLLAKIPEGKIADALLTQNNYKQSVFHLVANKESSLLLDLLAKIPEDKIADALLTQDGSGNSVWHLVGRLTPGLLPDLLAKIPEGKIADALLTQNNRAQSVFHLVANKDPSLLRDLLAKIPEDKIAEVLLIRDHHEEYLFYLIAEEDPSLLQDLLAKIPPSKIVETFLQNEHDEASVFHWMATEKPEWLKDLLAKIPKDNIAEVLLKKNRLGNQVIHLVASKEPQLLPALLDKIPKDKIAKTLLMQDATGDSVFHVVATDPELLRKLLAMIPMEAIPAALLTENQYGFTVSDLVPGTSEHLLKDLLAKAQWH